MSRRNARDMREADRLKRGRKKRLVTRKDADTPFIKKITQQIVKKAVDE